MALLRRASFSRHLLCPIFQSSFMLQITNFHVISEDWLPVFDMWMLMASVSLLHFWISYRPCLTSSWNVHHVCVCLHSTLLFPFFQIFFILFVCLLTLSSITLYPQITKLNLPNICSGPIRYIYFILRLKAVQINGPKMLIWPLKSVTL